MERNNSVAKAFHKQNCHIKNFIGFVVPRLFEEKRSDIVFDFPSVLPSILPSVLPSFRPPKVLCTLCAQLLLQFYADSSETLQMFLIWSEDMHVVWLLS